MGRDCSEFLKVALDAARLAERIALSYYAKKQKVRLKPDHTPVTVADQKAERAIIETIKKNFPDHGCLGEESGKTGTDAEYVWIIDPIDGTKNFISKIPIWGTLIALMRRQEVIVGVSNLPLLKETLWGVKGHGAFLNGEKVRVSGSRKLSQSMLSFGSLAAFYQKGLGKNILSLICHTKRQRAFGDLWAYHLLVAGKIDLVVEASIKLVDVAPFALIVEEAGGRTTDLEGNRLHSDISTFVATNGKLHNQVLRYFK